MGWIVLLNFMLWNNRLLTECANLKIDIVIVLDTSGSVGEENFPLVLGFAKSLINTVKFENSNVQVGVIQFATDVTPIFDLNDFTQDWDGMLAAVDSIEYSGGKTYTAGAIRLAVDEYFQEQNGARPDAKKKLMVVTDGKSTVESDDTIPAANYARQRDIHVSACAVNMTEDAQREELLGIANNRGSLIDIKDFNSLDQSYRKAFIMQCRCKYRTLLKLPEHLDQFHHRTFKILR